MATQQILVYADTSVYGGVFDDEFDGPSLTFFGQVREGRFRLCISPVVEEEIAFAPGKIREFFAKTSAGALEPADVDDAVLLQKAYLKAGILTRKSSNDALHVAFATVMRCPLLVSWNFKHIVHYGKIEQFNAVNVIEGYGKIGIHSPSEVITYEDDEEI
ncbi:MAG: hypothetical protein NUW37_04835 [Planctomycetes bacterium]|nr:hypothetical protein [Planctomycetota bacterium]